MPSNQKFTTYDAEILPKIVKIVPSKQLKCDKLVTFWLLAVTAIALIAQFVFYIEGTACITKLKRLKKFKT